MRRLFLVFFVISSCYHCFAQFHIEEEEIIPDRPGFGDAVSVVLERMLQVESGFWFEKEIVNHHVAEGIGINSTLLRYGLFKHTELRFDYNIWNSRTYEPFISTTGLFPCRIGMKYFLAHNKGIVPAVTFIGMQELPFSSTKKFKPQHYNTDLQFSFANALNHKLSFCYNLGAVMDFYKNIMSYYALSVEISITKKTGCYIQAHGRQFNNNRAMFYTEGGIMFYPNLNIQFDLSGGYKIVEKEAGTVIRSGERSWFFLTGGFSWRIKSVKKNRD